MKRLSSFLGALLLSATLATAAFAAPPERGQRGNDHSPANGRGGPPDHAAVLDLDHPRRIPDQFIVVLEPGSDVPGLSRSIAEQHGGEVLNTYEHALKGFALRVPEPAARGIARNPHVRYVEADKTVTLDATQSNPTWGLDRVDQVDLPLDDVYTYNFDGTGVHAYIVDTGIRGTHNDFGGRVSGGFTAINDGNGTTDCNGHGTHVAGTTGGSSYGIAKNVSLHPVRVLDCQGSGTNSGVIDGVDWVAANAQSPAVANMSLGGGASQSLDDAVNTAVANGVFFAVAAGNENTDACTKSPARASEVYTVGATDDTDTRASFSNYGSCVDIFAPGVSITSAWINSDSDTNTINGTSMASPHVAGAAALLLDEDGSLSPDAIKNTLTNNATTNVVSGTNGSPNRLLYTLNDGSGGGGGGGGGGGATELTNGTPVTNLSGASGDELDFVMDVPSGASNLSFQMSGGSGDADLYVRFGAEPTTSTYDCRPYKVGNDETCDFASPQTGTYYVMVRGYDSFSGVDLVGSYDDGSGGGGGATELTNGSPVTGLSGSSGDELDFFMDVPSDASNLVFDMSGGSGDADLYVKFGSEPTTSDYDCRPYLSGNNESCDFSAPSAGTYYVMVRGYSSFSGVDLVGSFDTGGGGGGPSTAYAENFDSGSAAGWNTSGGGSDLWRLADDCVSAASGSFTLSFSRPSPDCDYDLGSQATGWARSPSIDLSGAATATLAFNHYWETESYSGSYDVMQIQVSSDNGSSWTTIKQIDSSDANPSNYVSESLDVSAYISSTFRVRFQFDSKDGVSNDFPGWYVDDVEVTIE